MIYVHAYLIVGLLTCLYARGTEGAQRLKTYSVLVLFWPIVLWILIKDKKL